METTEKRLSARLALLLDTMNDRGKFHLHQTRHRGGCAELAWWCPHGRDPRWSTIFGYLIINLALNQTRPSYFWAPIPRTPSRRRSVAATP
jgi:hypothetical protein